jgi:hypothetical protein
MSHGLKRGRLGKTETAFITENAKDMPVQDIAQALNRDVETVNTWIRENLAIDVSQGEAIPLEETEIRNELRRSPEWEELRDQFIDRELHYFENRYAKLMAQFGENIVATEITQVFMLIKLEILMRRNLKARQRAVVDIERIEKEIVDISSAYKKRKDMPEEEKDRIISLENQLSTAREAESSKTGEYVKLSEKHSAILKELKGTRDQRIDKLESSKESVVGLLRALQEEEMRKQESEDMALMQLAVDGERDRLSKTHRYVDDSMDQPLLTPETVGTAEEENSHDSEV